MITTLVGCGFLGSLVAEELAKRQFALNDSTEMRLIDFDKVEERNAANQNFTKADAALLKAFAVAESVEQYGIPADSVPEKLLRANIDDLLQHSTFIIDAVDNIPTRHELWYWGKRNHVPILHLGVSQLGLGRVDWTYENFDSWILSPIATLGQKTESAPVPKELKPCELIAFRGLGLNMAIAAAKAIGIWRGFDPEHEFGEVFARTITTWEATNHGHTRTGVCEEYQ